MNIEKYYEYIQNRNKNLIDEIKNRDKQIEIICGEYELTVDVGVFNPRLGEGSILLQESIQHFYAEKVLEIGTGTGAIAIMVAKKSKHVVATDISPHAIKCARKNIERHNLEEEIDLREGSLFEVIEKGEKFDKIIYNPPFMNAQASNYSEMSYLDYNYEGLTSFFHNVKEYLNNNGSIYLCFGSVGDINYLNWIILKNGLKYNILINKLINNLQFFIYRISHEL